ncbi:GPW/gp25 family protein [Halobium palmae]|uniref:GPW/gp25 family protein n=1 Tax=Halobium palmae TaxID=1776492 RepID=A0ABD5RY12_9EURY
MTREFLGTGWQFPVATDRTGAIERSTADADIRESIRLVLTTAKGERVMRPDFGCGIHEFAFATVNTTTLSLVEQSVTDALRRWEPRIEVESVEASPTELNRGYLSISIDYRVRSTNTQANLVFPFYLREG